MNFFTKCILFALILPALAIFLSCQVDDDTITGKLKAKISGDVDLNFETDIARYTMSGESYGTLRQVSGTMLANGNEYKLLVKVQDRDDGRMVYDFSRLLTDGEVIFKIYDNGTNELIDNYSSASGTMTFTELDNKSIKGAFALTAINSNASKSITVTDGVIDLAEEVFEE